MKKCTLKNYQRTYESKAQYALDSIHSGSLYLDVKIAWIEDMTQGNKYPITQLSVNFRFCIII